MPSAARHVAGRRYRSHLDRITGDVRDTAALDADGKNPGHCVPDTEWRDLIPSGCVPLPPPALHWTPCPTRSSGACAFIHMPMPTANRTCPSSAGFGLAHRSFARSYPRDPWLALARRHSSAGSAVPVQSGPGSTAWILRPVRRRPANALRRYWLGHPASEATHSRVLVPDLAAAMRCRSIPGMTLSRLPRPYPRSVRIPDQRRQKPWVSIAIT